jgi:hypothetical protein
VRGRIKRGTLSSQRDADGTVYVLLGEGDQPSGQSDGQSRPAGDQPELVEVLQEQNDYLRRQLEVWQEEARRKDHIIAALAERIPAIEAPPEATGAPETASGESYGTSPPQEAEDSLHRRKRSWWREFLGIE